MTKSKTDPLIRAARKARREFAHTPLGRLQALCSLRSKWKRRKTIAFNKLEEIEDEIDSLATELANRGHHES